MDQNCECGGDCLLCEICELPECECACESGSDENEEESGQEEW